MSSESFGFEGMQGHKVGVRVISRKCEGLYHTLLKFAPLGTALNLLQASVKLLSSIWWKSPLGMVELRWKNLMERFFYLLEFEL